MLLPDAKRGGAAVPEGSTAGAPMAQGTRSPTAARAAPKPDPAPTMMQDVILVDSPTSS